MSKIFVTKDGQQYGPYSAIEVQQFLKTGQFDATDLGWVDGMSEWQPVGTLLEGSTPPPIPNSPPPPPKAPEGKKAGGCMKTLAALGLAFIVFTVIIAATSSEDEGITATNNVVPQDKSEIDSLHQMGESFTVGDLTYSITSATRTTVVGGSALENAMADAILKELGSIGVDTKSAGEAGYLTVRYTVKNTGQTPVTVTSMDFKIKDSQEREFSTSRDVTVEMMFKQDPAYSPKQLQPGISKNSAQIFELPREAFEDQLRLIVPEPGLFRSGQAEVNLVVGS